MLPAGDSLFLKLRELLTAYNKAAGGKNAPVLLVHDERHGAEMISLLSRFGSGLPARVLPLAINQVTEVGIDFFTSAFSYGAAGIGLLVGPDKKGELEGLASQIGLAETIMEGLGYGGGRIAILDERDPHALAPALKSLTDSAGGRADGRADGRAGAPAGNHLPMGGKRSRTNLALAHLHKQAPEQVEQLPLPGGAPFGAVKIDTAG